MGLLSCMLAWRFLRHIQVDVSLGTLVSLSEAKRDLKTPSNSVCVYILRCSLRSFRCRESSLKPAQVKCGFVRKQRASWAVLLC